MKIRKFLLAFTVLCFFSCEKDNAFDSEFDRSLSVWKDVKKEYDNNYNFTVTASSVFGFGSQTVITVKNGKVFSRQYESYRYDHETGEEEITDTWFEDENILNTHDEGAIAMTLDAVYNSCKNDILTVKKKR